MGSLVPLNLDPISSICVLIGLYSKYVYTPVSCDPNFCLHIGFSYLITVIYLKTQVNPVYLMNPEYHAIPLQIYPPHRLLHVA